MEILACPICKSHPLTLHVFEEAAEITEGLLTCDACGRWYPIIEEIPFMLPDELRDGSDDLPFLRKWRDRFPEAMLQDGKPFNASSL
jgi:uncharacterized protein YbaR (Trm112 family)